MKSLSYLIPEGTPQNPLTTLYADFEKQKQFYQQRRSETQAVVDMLTDRVQAEMEFAMRVEKISSDKYNKILEIGSLSKQIKDYKFRNQAKARQSADIAENVSQNCISPLKELLTSHDKRFEEIRATAHVEIERLEQKDIRLQSVRCAYNKSAFEAEKAIANYQRLKYDADMPYEIRKQAYDQMMAQLMRLSKSKAAYKEVIDEMNNFLPLFRKDMLKFCRQLRDLEFSRSEKVHSSINQFSVFEVSAEMSHKYDLQSAAAQSLDEFTIQQEMSLIDQYLYGMAQSDPDSVSQQDKSANRSILNLHAESSTDTENEESKEPSEESKEPAKKKKVAEDITVLPDAYVPVVKGQTFEFVQYEGKRQDGQATAKAFQVHNLTQEQIEEPKQCIYDYLESSQGSGIELSQEEKKALMNKILEKLFSASTQSSGQLNDEYMKIVGKLLESTGNRDLMVQQLQWRFSGEYFFSLQGFENLEKVIRKMYDSFADQMSGTEEQVSGGIEIVKNLSKRYYKRNQTKNLRYANKAAASLSLDQKLKAHRVWCYKQAWVSVCDSQESSFQSIKSLQQQMQASNVDPEIYEQVTRRALDRLENETEEAVQQRSDCIQNIMVYQEQYEAKNGEQRKEAQASQPIEAKKKEQSKKATVSQMQKNFSLQMTDAIGGFLADALEIPTRGSARKTPQSKEGANRSRSPIGKALGFSTPRNNNMSYFKPLQGMFERANTETKKPKMRTSHSITDRDGKKLFSEDEIGTDNTTLLRQENKNEQTTKAKHEQSAIEDSQKK